MGNDGGSIPTRRELVKEGARDLTTTQVKEIQTEQQEHYWNTCALSHQPLAQPVVSDASGSLYNKDAILDRLLAETQDITDKQELSKRGGPLKDRLRSLRDVVEVKFQIDEKDESTSRTRWICPITNKVLGPGTRAIYLVPCGHAFAESVVKEMPCESCLQCNEAYTAENIIPILPRSQSDKDRLEQRLRGLKEQGLTHSLKKALGSGKKRKKASAAGSGDVLDEPSDNKKDALPDKATVKVESAIKNQETALLTAKVLAEQEGRNKRRKIAGNDNVKSLFSSENGMDEKRVDFMTRGFSIPANIKR